MLPYKRSERVAQNIKRELADIIMNRLKRPVGGFITLTDVTLTPDLKLARVYVSVLKEEDRQPTVDALNLARRSIRTELARRISLRSLPELEFKLDSTAEYGDHMERLFKEIKKD